MTPFGVSRVLPSLPSLYANHSLGHQLAWEKARVLHRDVSVGNILIADEPRPGQPEPKKKQTGFLHDYDYSAMEADPSEADEDTQCPSSPSSGSCEGNPTETATAPDDPSKFKERTVGCIVMCYSRHKLIILLGNILLHGL